MPLNRWNPRASECDEAIELQPEAAEVERVEEPVAPCPHCGERPHVSVDAYGWSVACLSCFDADHDGERFVPQAEHAAGVSRSSAVRSWNDQADEACFDKENAR